MNRLFLLLIILALGIGLKAQKPHVLPVGSIDTLQVEDMVLTYYTYGPKDSMQIRHVVLIFPATMGVDPASERVAYELVQAGDVVCIPIFPVSNAMRGMEGNIQPLSRSEVNEVAGRITHQLLRQYQIKGDLICIGIGAGATQALHFSTIETRIRSTVLFYVHEPLLPSAFARLRAPVHAFVGEQETGVEGYVNHMQKYMYANGKQFTVHLVSDADDRFLGVEAPSKGYSANMAMHDMLSLLYLSR